MAEGLKPHHHQYYEGDDWKHTDEDGYVYHYVRYHCMICGKTYVDKYLIGYRPKPPPESQKVNKNLEKIKQRTMKGCD